MTQTLNPANVFGGRPQRTMGRKEAAPSARRTPGKLERKLAKLPLPPVIGLMFAGVGATLLLATPLWLLEQTVDQTGLSSIAAAAAPPLGNTARLLLAGIAALGFGIAAFAISWLIARIMPSAKSGKPAKVPTAPIVARDETGIGRRTPIIAGNELGSPLMSEEALDLGTALAAPDLNVEDDDLDLAAFAQVPDEQPEPAPVLVSPPPIAAPDTDPAPTSFDASVFAPAQSASPVPETHQEPESDSPRPARSVNALLEQLEGGLDRLSASGRTMTRPGRSAAQHAPIAASR